MDTTLAQLSTIADQWASWCASSLLGTSLVLAIVSAFWWIGRGRRSPHFLCLLFFLVMLKPYAPVSIAVPNAIASRLPIAFENTQRVSDPPPLAALSVNETERPVQNDPQDASLVAPPISNRVAVIAESVDKSHAIDADATAMGITQDTVARDSSQLTWSRWLIPFAVYCIVLFGLLLRFIVNQIRFHVIVQHAKSINADRLPFDMSDACCRAGLKQIPRIVELKTASPAVWGLIRPTLILPRGLVGELSEDSLCWAVMHELAHLKRRDIIFHGVQKMLTLVQFWNPAVWIASSMINRFREQACDDMALVWCDRQSVSAGEAFMHVVRTTNDRAADGDSPRRLMAGSLGVFSSGSKQACAIRLNRLLDSDRPLREKMSAIAFLSLIIAAAILLPKLHSADAAPQVDQTTETNPTEASDPATPADQEKFVAADGVGEFELVIVGPKNEPVPNAEVEIRPKQKETWELLAGKFKRNHQYGTVTTADAAGRLRVKLPTDNKRGLQFSIKAPGYGLFWAQWRAGEQSEVMPAKYVAHLDAGQSVGGVVVDDDGQPVAGARVHPSIEYKKRETDESQLSTGWSVKTDDKGLWQCDFVPESYDQLSVEVVHKEYVPTRLGLPLPKYRLNSGEPPTQPLTIDRGITLTGKVTDNADRPIQNANVRVVFVNETRSVKTDADGMYRIPGCAEGSEAVTVTAKTFAPEQKVVDFRKQLAPVDFQLNVGNTIRVRVVDNDGNPEKKARIFFRNWRQDSYGKGLGMVHAYTDENGIWEWNEAPADSFVADVCPVGGVTIGNQLLRAREEEYVFKAISQLMITGNVVDAVTKNPIESFRVIPGLVWQNANEVFWTRRDSFDARDGQFRLTEDRMDARHAIRIEAAGYRPAVSRFIKIDEGDVSLNFELQTATPVNARILRPDGTPAVGAEAAIGISGTQIGVNNGEFSGTFAQLVQANSSGSLTFAPDTAPIRIIVLDASGYADAVIQPNESSKEIQLTAWARVHGTLTQGDRPGANVLLTLSPNQSRPIKTVMDVSWSDRVVTDKTGAFRFERVRPGDADLYRSIPSHNTGQTSQSAVSHRKRITTQPGEDKTFDLGNEGYTVVAKAEVEVNGEHTIDWEFSSLEIKPVVGERPAVPYPADLPDTEKSNWYQTWTLTDEGKQFAKLRTDHFYKSIQSYGCKVGEDGKILVDSVPSGKYLLTLQLDERPKEIGYASVRLGAGEVQFEIAADRPQGTPIDLGTIVIK